MAETLQLTLSPSPTDIPSSLVFHPQTPTSLLVSSWDSTLRYYTISTNPSAQLISQYNHPAPILDCKFSADGKNAITASVNGNVNWYLQSPVSPEEGFSLEFVEWC
jgi:cell cycle arrest protein BUB3